MRGRRCQCCALLSYWWLSPLTAYSTATRILRSPCHDVCMCVCVCVGVYVSTTKRKPLIGMTSNLAQSSTLCRNLFILGAKGQQSGLVLLRADQTLCRNVASVPSLHLLGRCSALAEKRRKQFGNHLLFSSEIRHWNSLLKFAINSKRFQ